MSGSPGGAIVLRNVTLAYDGHPAVHHLSGEFSRGSPTAIVGPNGLWQNSSGEAAIWELNGTAVIGAASLGNLGPDWHIMGTGDYNHDGRSDIPWQNSSGQVVTWEMNGSLANRGPTWHV